MSNQRQLFSCNPLLPFFRHQQDNPHIFLNNHNSLNMKYTGTTTGLWLEMVMPSCLLFMGSLAHSLVTQAKMTLAETHIQSIAVWLGVESKDAFLSWWWAGVTLSHLVGELYPNAFQWAYVQWLNFERGQNAGNVACQWFALFLVCIHRGTGIIEAFSQATCQKPGFLENAGVSTP
jgi:hypothetical protein